MTNASADGGVNTRLLRGALLVVAAGLLGYLVLGFFQAMLFRHVVEGIGAVESYKWTRRIQVFIETALELAIVGGLVTSAIAVWRAAGPARFLLLGAAVVQLIGTTLDLAFTLVEREPVRGVDWMNLGIFSATLLGTRCLSALGIHFAMRSSGRALPWSLPLSTIGAVVVGQGVTIYRASVLTPSSGRRSELPNVIWYYSNTLGHGLSVALLLIAGAALAIGPGRSARTRAASGFASLRSMAITRLALGITFAVFVQICIASQSFGAAYWLLALLLPITIALGYWGVFATANASTQPPARVVAFFSSALFIASMLVDYAASRRVSDMLDAVRTSSFAGTLDALEGVPSLVLAAGLLQVVATALLFRTIAAAAEGPYLTDTRRDANRGMWLSIVASLPATIVNAGRSSSKPWFGLAVIIPLGLVALVLAIMAFTSFLRTTQTLAISLPDGS